MCIYKLYIFKDNNYVFSMYVNNFKAKAIRDERKQSAFGVLEIFAYV